MNNTGPEHERCVSVSKVVVTERRQHIGVEVRRDVESNSRKPVPVSEDIEAAAKLDALLG